MQKTCSGITSYFQFGANDSVTLPVNQYFGAGFTEFGLMPRAPATRLAWAWHGHG
jgi:hypothetical protein